MQGPSHVIAQSTSHADIHTFASRLLRYCESPEALTSHQKGKVHKRRLKDLKFGAYTHEEAMRAAGKGGVDNKQRGVEPIVRRMEGVDDGEGKEEFVKGVEA